MRRMGMTSQSDTLSGVWTGEYQHDQKGREGATFSAWLTITEDRLTGSTLEPNTFAETDQEELDALLRGHVHGEEVVFLKIYQGLKQEPVYCEGTISEDGRKIVGKWFFSWPDEISGTFEMVRRRVKADAHEAVTQKATS